MQRVLRASAAPIQLLTYDANGALADPSSQPSTADVTDSAGVAAAGSPYAVTRDSTGTYHITLQAALTILDTYQVAWNSPDGTKRYTEFEMVGGFYFTIAEFKASDAALASYTADQIRTVRDVVEERFEKRCNVAFVPRGNRWAFPGNGTWTAQMPDILIRQVISVTVGGIALSAPNVAAIQIFPGGVLQRTDGIWAWATVALPQNCSVLYEFGMGEPPGPVKAAALRYARHLIVPHSFEDDRMISYQTDVGTVQQAVARNGALGFPDVDSVLDSYSFPDALVG